MRQYATVRENFMVLSWGDNQGAIDMMRRELCQLGALMLMDAVTLCQIQLETEDNEYIFSDTRPTAAYYSMVRALGEVNMVMLNAKYRYACDNGFAQVPPLMMNHYIDNLEEGLPDGVFYSFCRSIDKLSNPETVIVNGRQKLHLHKG